MQSVLLMAVVALSLIVLSPFAIQAEESKTPAVLNFKMKSIDGKEVDLASYKGKVVLFVNVASECGLTPQYKGLQKLHDQFSKDGLVIIGVPANEFGAQEPGSDAEISEFCTKNYGVKFPMLSKVVVKGTGICPLYEYLTSKTTNPEFGGPITWNFTKFLISKEGKIVNRFEPRVSPEDEKVISAIQKELKK